MASAASRINEARERSNNGVVINLPLYY